MNRPINFNDPTGHAFEQGTGFGGGDCILDCQLTKRKNNKDKYGGEPSVPSEENHFSVTNQYSYVFHVIPIFSGGREMSNDDFVNGIEQTACLNPRMGVGCAISTFVRLVPPNTPPQSFDANFWVNYTVTHNEYSGINISDFIISNNSGKPINVGLSFESGGEITRYPAITVGSGFGDYELTDLPTFDGNKPVVIKMKYEMMVNMGSASHPGPSTVYPPLIYHSLPSVTSLMQFTESGQAPTLFP